MHGRLKVKTTKEQEEEKKKERMTKLAIFQAGKKKVLDKRLKEEYDRESLNTTEQLLRANPDFYTLWNFRKEILLYMTKESNEEEKDKIFKEELALTESCLQVNPKSYGTWHQRSWALETMPNPDWQRELKLCNRYLELDERNFHCWDYRRYIVEKAKIPPEDELKFTMQKINNNFSNYSSWHYRSKLLPLVYPNPKGNGHLQEEKFLEELELVQNAAFTDPNDQSAWFYHRWLLGRGEKPLAIKSLYINKKNCCAIISMTQELSVTSKNLQFHVLLNGDKLTDVSWEPSDKNLAATSVWLLKIPPLLDDSREHAIEIILEDGDKESCLNVSIAEKTADAFIQEKISSGFKTELSVAASNILQQELNSCEQLQEFEPDNKWMLLTSILLMRAIDQRKFRSEVSENLKKLMELDSYRKHYYEDLWSKFVLEDLVENLLANQREIKICSESLTSLHHMDCLTQITVIDVSNNHLRSLKPFHPLQCLHKLIADSNHIENCSGVDALKYLQHLSLNNNKIISKDALAPLLKNEMLSALFLNENPFSCGAAEIYSWLKENASSLKEISL